MISPGVSMTHPDIDPESVGPCLGHAGCGSSMICPRPGRPPELVNLDAYDEAQDELVRSAAVQIVRDLPRGSRPLSSTSPSQC